MTFNVSIRLSQTTIALGVLVVAGSLAVGYELGRRAERSAGERETEHLQTQIMKMGDENMRMWRETYSERFRNPPVPASGPPPGAPRKAPVSN